MVKIELARGDFVWIGLVVVLLGVGFGYAYGGGDPGVMGHSAGEVETGSDSDTLADLDCTNDQIAKYNDISGVWECAVEGGADVGGTFAKGSVVGGCGFRRSNTPTDCWGNVSTRYNYCPEGSTFMQLSKDWQDSGERNQVGAFICIKN